MAEASAQKSAARTRTRKAKAEDRTLFGESDSIEQAGSKPDSLYLYTNNFNVLEILACGYAKPRYAYAKYYQDLLGISKGWIPLVSGAVGSNVVKTLCSESPSYPVALRLTTPAAAEASRFSARAGSQRLMALRGSIPRTEFDALIFASDSEREQFAIREYEGIDLSDKRLEVNPALFSSDGDAEILEPLANLPAVESPELDRYLVANRLAGGMATLLAFETAKRLPSHAAAVSGMSGVADLHATLGLPAVNLFTAASSESAPVDERIFAASLAVLRDVDRFTSWDPVGIVERIEAAYLSGPSSPPSA